MPRKLSMNEVETVKEIQAIEVQIKESGDQNARNRYAARRSRLIRHLSQASSATMVAAQGRTITRLRRQVHMLTGVVREVGAKMPQENMHTADTMLDDEVQRAWFDEMSLEPPVARTHPVTGKTSRKRVRKTIQRMPKNVDTKQATEAPTEAPPPPPTEAPPPPPTEVPWVQEHGVQPTDLWDQANGRLKTGVETDPAYLDYLAEFHPASSRDSMACAMDYGQQLVDTPDIFHSSM
jgi:hypothetical protein